MKKKFSKIALACTIMLLGCTTTQTNGPVSDWKPDYRISAGANSGGIVENTDMKEAGGLQPDAFTGATHTGIHAAGHVILPVRKNAVVTGLEVMNNNQTFTYNDDINGFYGNRKISTTQLMIPLTYRFGFFRKNNPDGLLQLRLGYLAQLNFLSVNDDGSQLPAYSSKKYSGGLTLGLAVVPFKFEHGGQLGLYVDGYRGTRIYEDFYNQPAYKIPGSSFMRGGIFYQFK
jgi:hypothetical protein